MWCFVYILCISSIPGNVLSTGNLRNWDYTVLNTFANSSNPDFIDGNSEITRIGRGEYTVSGKLIVNMDIDETCFTECLAYRSASGSNNFKLLPFRIPRQPSTVFMATTYRRFLMPSLGNCSNAPQSVDNRPPELKRGTYTFNKCIVSAEYFPNHIQSGLYKVQLLGFTPIVNYTIEVIAEVEPRYGSNIR